MDAPQHVAERRSLWPGLLLLTACAAIGAVFALYASTPVTLSRIAVALKSLGGSTILWGGLAGIVALGLLVLLLYRPAWPALRLALSRFSKRLSFDQKTAADLRARLQEFENPKDLLDLGRLYLDARRPREALPLLLRTLELDPNARAAMLAGQGLAMLGQNGDAATLLDQAIAVDPKIGFGAAVLERARVAQRMGEDDHADQLAKQHEKLFGPDIQNLWLQAEVAKAAGQSEARQVLLGRTLELATEKLSPADALVIARARGAYRGPRLAGGAS